MLVIIRSAPDTPEGRRGVKLARSMYASLILLQNGVYFTQGQILEDLGFVGSVYVLEDDKRVRGLTADGMNIKSISYDSLIDFMAESEKVVGMF